MSNMHAADAIRHIHEASLNDKNVTDLHWLHANEAVECLDMFIDQHLRDMLNDRSASKSVEVITGRGLHSPSGISTVKPWVEKRLTERRVR